MSEGISAVTNSFCRVDGSTQRGQVHMSRSDMTGKPWLGNLLAGFALRFEVAGSGFSGNGSSTAICLANSSWPEFHCFVVVEKRACLVAAGKRRIEHGMRVVKARNADMSRVVVKE